MRLIYTTIEKIKTARDGKGKSIIDFPDDYVVIDIETTGLSPTYDEIIEISALKYHSNVLIDKFVTLVRPYNLIDEYIINLTGITNEMVSNAPTINECIQNFYNFIGDSTLVGYNVNFDINFLYDNLLECTDIKLNNNFVDVMRIAKKVLPDLERHTQSAVCEHYKIKQKDMHRAEADCLMCHSCFDALKNDIISQNQTLENFCASYKRKPKINAKKIVPTNDVFDTQHPLYKKVCVFTGTLEKMPRKEAMQIVADLGGIPANSVTKNTNYLILGNNDYCKSIKDGKSSKQKKAEKYILEGMDIKILSEQVFYDLIFEN